MIDKWLTSTPIQEMVRNICENGLETKFVKKELGVQKI